MKAGGHFGDTVDTDPIARQLLQLSAFPVFYNGLVLITTTRCNAQCGMCYQSAGPKGSPLMGKARLDLPVLERAVREAAGIDAVAPRFHLAGGEAFMDMDACLRLIRCARDAGYELVSATTNAFWAKDIANARKVAEACVEAGLDLFEISWDHWHKPWIAPACIDNCITVCAEVGIETNLRLLTTRNHRIPEALGELDPAARAKASVITSGPVTGSGRGAALGDNELFVGASPIDGGCHSMLHLTINPTGEVMPCCAGIDQTGQRFFGNVKEESLFDIVDRMQHSALLRILVFDGVASFLPILEEAGLSPGKDFVGMCDLCWSVFADNDRTRAIEDHLDRLRVKALKQLVADMENARPHEGLVDA